MDIKKVLKNSMLFSMLSEKELAELQKGSVLKELKRADVLFEEGEKGPFVYFLASGFVKAARYLSDGRQIAVEVFSPGEIIGDAQALNGASNVFTAVALSPSELLAIRKESFFGLVSGNPSFCAKLMEANSKKLASAYSKLVETMSERIEQRLARGLVMLLNKIGSVIPFTGTDLAAMTGTTLETVYRMTGNLKQYGMIKTSRGKVIVTDPERLRLLAEGMPFSAHKKFAQAV